MTMQKFSPLTNMKYAIIGVAKAMYYRLGPDHQEDIYDGDCPASFEEAGFRVEIKPIIQLLDVRGKVIKTYIPDFRVTRGGMSMLIELKADPKGIQGSYVRKARSYLRASEKDQAIVIINFARAKKGIPENVSVFRSDLFE